jgi:predicted deacylase
MKLVQTGHRLVQFYTQTPKKYFILVGASFLIVIYALVFFIPKSVIFSYAGETCTRQLTLFPSIQQAVGNEYVITFKDTWMIGSFPVIASSTCFAFTKAPAKGEEVVSTAPFGWLIVRKYFLIKTPEVPTVRLAALRKAIPATKPIILPISTPDSLHSYRLSIANKQVGCEVIKSDLMCDITKLKLDQGTDYSYKLSRQFNKNQSKQIGGGTITTLKAVAVVDGSIMPTQTIYDRPKEITFTFDKEIKSLQAELSLDGKAVLFAKTVKDKRVVLVLNEELPREKVYSLVLKEVEATDGSGLVEPYVMKFTTSGGPVVSNVSVGQTGVSQSAGIILTFDQSLSKTQDVAKLIGLAGGTAMIQKLNDTQVRVQLQALPLCQPFSITAEVGIESEHKLISTKKWSFSGRIVCYVTTQYGTSLKGRPLIAYQFGSSGPTTMYVGAIHGNEASSSGLMKAWISELEANSIRVQGRRIVVIPTINPDGMATGTRTNSRGVNLNRNFPTSNWVADINDTDGRNQGGGGRSPLSEPEAAALASYTRQVRPALLLSFHAVGSLVAGDPGGYSAGFASKYASMAGYRDVTNSSHSSFEYDITGSYEDWTYRNEGIPSVVIELGSYEYFSVAHHRNALWAMVQ